MQDLFSFDQPTPAPAAAAPPPAAPPSRPATARQKAALRPVPAAWERLLAQADDVPIVICVSVLWTGIGLEVISTPQLGRQSLQKDYGIVQFSGVDHPCRNIYMAPDEARALARDHGLILLGTPGQTNARFRFVPDTPMPLGPIEAVLASLAPRK